MKITDIVAGLVAGCAALALAWSAEGASVNLATGLDASGGLQIAAGYDAFWQVTGAAAPIAAPYAFVVGDSSPDTGFPLWGADGPNSSWIAANPDNPRGNGLMTFTRSFTVNDPSTAAIVGGAWAIDDIGVLSLNGNVLGVLGAGRSDPYALIGFFTTPSDFVAGLNVLTMQITETDFYVEGARLEGFLTGNVADVAPLPPPPGVPEPSGWALMLTGAGLAGAMLRRGRGVVVSAR